MKVVDNIEPKTFAERLGYLCDHFSIDIAKMATYIGIPHKTLQDYLHSHKTPCEMDMHRLAKFFGISRELLNGDGSLFNNDWGLHAGIPLFTIVDIAELAKNKTPIPTTSVNTTCSRVSLTGDCFAVSGTIIQAFQGGLSEQSGRFFIQPTMKVVSMTPYLFYDVTRPGLIIYLVSKQDTKMYLHEADNGQPGIPFNQQQHQLFGGLQQVLFS